MKTLHLLGNNPTEGHRHLLKALAELHPVKFLITDTPMPAEADAALVLDGNVDTGLTIAAMGTPTFVAAPVLHDSIGLGSMPVTFGTSHWIDACLQGRTMQEKPNLNRLPLTCFAGDDILASTPNGPVWIARPSGRSTCFICSAPPPLLNARDRLLSHFNGRQFMSLLPLLNFLRFVCQDLQWDSPPLRACFVFDDPSLYWRSYGFLNYEGLAEHAARHNYSVAVATIPLDTWWVSSRVVATLHSHQPRLSVMIHGNNHTNHEMMAGDYQEESLAVAAQAMRRMDRMEQRHGLAFSRVMEAPHGAIACHTFPNLLTLGYEGALCTPELLVKNNPAVSWPSTVGLSPAELLGGGLPVLPRIMMSPDWKNEVIRAAFLRQPIILAGHHQDAADDMRLLANFAALVNSIPNVIWTDMRGILTGNYQQIRQGNLLTVRLFSRRVIVPIPQGVHLIKVLRPWLAMEQTEKLVLHRLGEPPSIQQSGPATEVMELNNSASVEISSEIRQTLHYSKVSALSTTPWPIARKLIMEARDRLSPVFPFVDRLRRREKP